MAIEFGDLNTLHERKMFDCWNEGIKAAMDDPNINQKQCPYPELNYWTAWVGGMWKGKYVSLANKSISRS